MEIYNSQKILIWKIIQSPTINSNNYNLKLTNLIFIDLLLIEKIQF